MIARQSLKRNGGKLELCMDESGTSGVYMATAVRKEDYVDLPALVKCPFH